MSELSQIVKAYDIRGVVPDQWDERVAEALGVGFAAFLASSHPGTESVVIAHDMRASSPGLSSAFGRGVLSQGLGVIETGLGSTDMLYFAAGTFGMPGAMFTASHNPAQYNGIKLCLAGAKPISQDSGLAEIRANAQRVLDGPAPTPATDARPDARPERREVLADYARYLRDLVDLRGIRPLKVVVDAGNGMGGYTVPAVLGDEVLEALPLTIVPLYFELDGSFPNHEANPLEPKNLVDLQDAVVRHGADLGLAFDGDADRCFVIDERGEPVSPSAITALVAARELAKHPGDTIIYNLITSSAVPEIIKENGGTPVRSRVGHSFIKADMARTNAVFGGEHSAHYYFRDFWFADTGMLAAMHVLAALGGQAEPLSRLGAEFERYVASGEINSTVQDQGAKQREVRAAYPDTVVDELDGLTLTFPDGAWLNLRASNTEPLLRLNVEAPTTTRMAELRDGVLGLIRR